MKARIYQCLNVGLLDPGDAFVLGEEALFAVLTQLYGNKLLELRKRVLNIFPDAIIIEREKLFCSTPMYLSVLVLISAEEQQVASILDQMRVEGDIAAWENGDREQHPSLLWTLKHYPRSQTLASDLKGLLRTRDFGSYHLRVFAESLSLRLVGINASTGQSISSQREETYGVLTLDFSLNIGESLLLWCLQDDHQKGSVVATAEIRLMSHIFIEQEEGIHIQDREESSPGISLSP